MLCLWAYRMPSRTRTSTRADSCLERGGGCAVWGDEDALLSLGLAVVHGSASLEVRRTQRWTTGTSLLRVPGRGTVQTELLRLFLRLLRSW